MGEVEGGGKWEEVMVEEEAEVGGGSVVAGSGMSVRFSATNFHSLLRQTLGEAFDKFVAQYIGDDKNRTEQIQCTLMHKQSS